MKPRRPLSPFALLLLGVFALPAAGAPQILPSPLADRTFQYLQQADTFLGTPLEVAALTPYAVFVVGAEEDPALFLQAATVAYMVGQWSQEPGTSLEAVRENRNLGPVLLDKDLSPELTRERNVVLLGRNNSIYPAIEARLTGKGSFIQVIEDAFAPGRDLMFVSDAKAAGYLANKRLYFKSGAYAGFFAFVKARALIERGEFIEALSSLDNPEAIRGCGKPVMLAIGHKDKLPPEMLAVAQKRNKLVFKDLRAALTAGDKEQAAAVWQAAMETCYGCHQGRGGVKQYRKFVPNEVEHGYHQKVAAELGAACNVCHQGVTAGVGYR